METHPRYVIVGAGAVGSAIGGLLSASGSSVLFVARSAIANAIKEGLTIRRDDHETVIKAPAVTEATAIIPGPNDVVIITVKSQHTETAIEQLAAVYDRNTPVICMQNGVSNEETAARRFDRVYAGLVLLTAVQLEPNLVTITVGKTLAIGRYPDGEDASEDAVLLRACEDLMRAGFDTLASGYVMAMKWGKLVANLNNATHAITGYWLERGMAESEMRQLMVEVREEGLRVLDAAGIAVEPSESEPSPIRIRHETKKMKGSPLDANKALNLPVAERGYPSMWQDLHLGRGTNEADFLNGEIVRLGKKLGISTPYNETLLEVMNRMSEERRQPGLYSPSELRALVMERAK